MRIKLIKMVNFRQFYGENELGFSMDPEKNITLIHGENGVGKTTLLNAILWCLFEKLTPDFERPKELVNYEAMKENRSTCRVEVTFVYEGNEYLAQRHHIQGGTSPLKVYQIDEGNFREMPGPKGFINSVLPQDMAPYFFFHGEGVASISDSKSSAKFREAVRNILGFTFAEAAIDDLKKVRTEYTRNLANLSSKESGLKEAAERKANSEEKLERFRKKLQVMIAEAKDRSDDIQRIEETLGNSGHLDAERLKREIGASGKRLAGYRIRLESVARERQALIPKYGWVVFGSKLVDQGLDFIDESTLKGKIPSPYQDSFVNDLLEAGSCICGTAIPEGSVGRENVKKLLESANTALINQKVMKARSVASNVKGRLEEFLEELRRLEKEKGSLDKAIGEEERTLKDLESELIGIDEESIKKLTVARERLKNQEKDLLRAQGALKVEIGRCEEIFATASRDLAVGGANSKAVQRVSAIQSGIEEMIKRCEDRLDEFESSARNQIARMVNEFLEGFSRKDYQVRVTESFDFHLARTDGQVVAKSKGERLLLNLAFVSALIEQAEARSKASGKFLVQGTVAPFVIDAPFGELDDTYRRATAEFLPTKVNQIAFLLSTSHWKGPVDETIRRKVGKEYILISSRTGEQGNKPTDPIEINGQTYYQSRYGASLDQTTIEKVK